MQKKFKFKFYAICAMFFTTILTSCETKVIHKEQGYTQKVIYDLGEGMFTGNNRNTHTLTLYFQPGSYITDFSGNQKYEFTRTGTDDVTYEFGGWYFDQEYANPVVFSEYTLPTDSDIVVTIYAKWIEIYDKHFNIYYQADASSEFSLLTSLKWDMNKQFTFDSSQIVYPSEDEYTYIGAYTNEEMTIEVDDTYLLTREIDELPIYTKWVKGKYHIVNTAKDYQNYFSKNVVTHNLYINNDIDLTGINITYVSRLANKTILGNNHTISNYSYSTIKGEGGSKTTVTLGGLADILENVTIKDLTFANATYTMASATCSYLNFAPLAGEMVDCVIDNVKINGTITYDAGTLSRLENASLKAIRVVTDGVAYIDSGLTASSVTNCTFEITDLKGE